MKRRVLLAEDDKMTQKYLVQKLVTRFEVQTAETAQEAIALLISQKFDLAVLDMMLAEGTGTDIMKFLQQQKIKIPVLVLSANTDPAVIKEVKQLGAISYLSKDQSLSDLFEEINKAMLAL